MNETEATELVAALFDRWYAQLVRYAIRSAGDHDLAEDLVQDAFMQLYGALRSGKCIEFPKAWVMCVLRRAINKQVQARFDYDQLEDHEHMQGERRVTCLSLIADYLHVLSSREEEVLLLRLEAMKYKEIADQLGISMSSVNTILARALRKLKRVAAQHAVQESVDLHEKKSFNRAS